MLFYHFLELLLAVLKKFGILRSAAGQGNFQPQHQAKLITRLAKLGVTRVMCMAYKIETRFFNQLRICQVLGIGKRIAQAFHILMPVHSPN